MFYMCLRRKICFSNVATRNYGECRWKKNVVESQGFLLLLNIGQACLISLMIQKDCVIITISDDCNMLNLFPLFWNCDPNRKHPINGVQVSCFLSNVITNSLPFMNTFITSSLPHQRWNKCYHVELQHWKMCALHVRTRSNYKVTLL